jgi:hypothetical protein
MGWKLNQNNKFYRVASSFFKSTWHFSFETRLTLPSKKPALHRWHFVNCWIDPALLTNN